MLTCKAEEPGGIRSRCLELPDLFEGPEGKIREIFAHQSLQKLIEANRYNEERLANVSNYCKAGCCFCCNQIFNVSLAEIAAITLYLATNREKLDAFEENFSSCVKSCPDKYEKIARHYPESGKQEKEDFLEYYKLKYPCEFLSNGLCMIYEARPLVCSSYISFAPARICSFEPKGYLPKEISAHFTETRQWFENQSRRRYSKEPPQTVYWVKRILENLQAGTF